MTGPPPSQGRYGAQDDLPATLDVSSSSKPGNVLPGSDAQCRKHLRPVWIMTMPYSPAAAVTSSSRAEPPG